MDSFQLVIESSQFDETTEDRLYQHITDGLFSQFFPESSNSVYCKEDVNFFINYVNEEASLTRELSSDDEGHGCISLSKLKFHLSKILCRGWSSNEATAKPLNFYKLEVCMHLIFQNTNTCIIMLNIQTMHSVMRYLYHLTGL